MSLTGIGIVLGVIGFAWSLYAMYMEDDLNDVFLKRSYWGIGGRYEGKFGGKVQGQSPTDLTNLTERALTEECEAFAALALGAKATVQWSSSLSTMAASPVDIASPDMMVYTINTQGVGYTVEASIENAVIEDGDMISWSLEIKSAGGAVDRPTK